MIRWFKDQIQHPDLLIWMGIWAALVVITFAAFGLIQ